MSKFTEKYHACDSLKCNNDPKFTTCEFCGHYNYFWERKIGKIKMKLCVDCNMYLDDRLIELKKEQKFDKEASKLNPNKMKFINAKDIKE